MGGLGFIALISVLIGAATPTNRRYSGFLGCRFSNSVCLPDERCVNDRLFGSCQRVSRAVGLGDDDASQDDALDDYQYYLDSDTLAKLEREIERLIAHGYTWNNLYTQCVLGNILLAFRMDVQDYDETWCDRGGLTEQQFDEALTDETLAFLEEYFRDYYPSSSSDTDEQLEMPSRRYDPQTTGGGDDYVQVHKYLANKRDSGDVDDAWFPDDDVIEDQEGGDDMGSMMDVDQLVRGGVDDATFDNLLSRLNVDDLLSLQSYLRTLDNNRPAIALPDDQQQESYGSDVLGESSVDNDTGSDGFVVGAGGGSFDEGQLAYYPSGPDGDGLDLSSVPDLPISTVDTLLPDRAASSLFDDATDDLLQQEPENEELTQPDAALLSALLRDELSVDDLSDSEVRRLSSHVEWILGVLRSEVEPESLVGDEGNSEGYKMSAIEQEPVPPLILDNSDKAVVDGDNYAADKRAQPSVLEQSPIAAGSSDDAGSVDAHDHGFDTATEVHPTKGPRYEILEADYGNFYLQQKINDEASAVTLIAEIQSMMDLPQGTMEFYSVQDGVVTFRVLDNDRHINASQVLDYAKSHATDIEKRTGLIIVNTGLGRDTKINLVDERANGPKYFVLTFVLCGTIAAVVLAVIAIYIVRQHTRTKEKLAEITSTTGSTEATKDYQDLCRQRMQSKASEKPEPLSAAITRVGSVSAAESVPTPSQTSSHSSTSSWSEEPVVSNMDISTGHIVLSYMEDHLKNKDRLTEEWEALCAYEAEPNAVTVAMDNANARKNRYSDVLPYDHSRVTLSEGTNVSQGNYINASTITDHDPRNPAYIATQGPLPHTVADFWQMIWEQGSVVIVMLTRTTENGVAMCHRYWPEEGSDLYHIYEVHLVSEHIWCDDYLVRSFFLKNLQTNETRTVTQFHFLTWQDLGVPGSVKALLDFRRKVNKSYRGRSCPIVIHCSDGAGRTGTYCLTDMVLNRMSKGAKEIDIAATLEHIRDQRMMMVKTKEQFEFALSSVAEEVHAILKALPQ